MRLINVESGTIQGDFSDHILVWQQFIDVVNKLPGLTVINSVSHVFPGGGVTGLILLGESHAALHTWPESGLAWVELATCGDPEALPEFWRRLADIGFLLDRD